MDATQRRVNIPLWTGVLAGPIAWAADLQARYALVKYVCANGAEWMMWVITLAALIVTGFGALCSWRGWVDNSPRVKFMAIGGLLIGATFALSIIAMAIPDFFMRACD